MRWRELNPGDPCESRRETKPQMHWTELANDSPLHLQYAVFSLPSNASFNQVRAEYRKLATLEHPDRVPPELRPGAEERMKVLNAAYAALRQAHAL